MISFADVGCWIVKGNPATWDYFRSISDGYLGPEARPGIHERGWTLGSNYRNAMIRQGDLIALWITGPKNPGIYEFGYVTGDLYEVDGMNTEYAVDSGKARVPTVAVPFVAKVLHDEFVPRAEMKTDPVLAGCEQFRAPQVANPSYLTPGEAQVLAQQLAARTTKGRMRATRWDSLL